MILNKFSYWFIIVFSIWLSFLFFYPTSESVRSEKELVIMSYSSFLQPWGPGPLLEKEFLAKYGIKIRWLDVGNAGLILERLRFKFNTERPDLVIGLDQLSLEEARKVISWKTIENQELNKNKIEELPTENIFHDFIPFDWSPMVFVAKKELANNIKSLKDLTEDKYKSSLALQDPRSSAPGLQFLFWILSLYGEQNGFKFLKKLKPSIHSLSPSWSISYSLFKSGQAPMVFSYVSSPLFHKIEENDDSYSAVILDENIPIQVEYMGVPHLCMNCSGARLFVDFILSKKSQKILMEKNYMWPVVEGVIDGTPFDQYKNLKFIDSMKFMNWSKEKLRYLNEWKKISI